MRYPKSTAVLLVLVFVCGTVADGAELVIKKDGTRVEGRILESLHAITVTTKSGRLKRIPRKDVKLLVTVAMPLHERFRLDPRPEDLLILASRAGIPLSMDEAKQIMAEVFEDGKTPEAADMLLSAMRLTPEHTKKVVEKNIVASKKQLGSKAIVVECKHYSVVTNLDRAQANLIAMRMDGIYEEYQKRLVFKEKIVDKFLVKVFRSETEYIASGAPGFSAAYFCSQRRKLVAYKSTNIEQMFSSLYHEGMHQFLRFYVSNPPRWFDEGLAKYFESARPMRRATSSRAPSYSVGTKLGPECQYIRRQAQAGGLIPLPKLISMSRREFYSGDIGKNYSQAWAFTHFLVESRSKKLKQLWVDYFFELRDGASMEEANKRVFGKVDMVSLTRMFQAYAKRL